VILTRRRGGAEQDAEKMRESQNLRTRRQRRLSIWGAVVVCWCSCAFGHGGPRPPCGAEPVPAYPSLADSPAVKFWSADEVGEKWRPPACTGWTGEGFSTLVTTVARFRRSGGMEELLRQNGAISQLAGMRYWSTTHQSWQTLIVDAYAVTGERGNERRKDFTVEELKAGSVLYFEQVDSLSGKAVFRLHIVEATADRLVFDLANVTLMKYLIVPLFHPGEMQSIYYLDRESDDVWRYYSMSRTGKNASSLTVGHEASWINRAVAFFRHVAGIPTDQEPPAAR
jgi:hypothetical protein